MISHQEEKGGVSGGLALPIVVSKFGYWEISSPIVLLMISKEMQVCLHPLIVLFRLPIGSGVVGQRYVLLNSQNATQFLCELRCETRVSITDDLVWETIVAEDFFQE